MNKKIILVCSALSALYGNALHGSFSDIKKIGEKLLPSQESQKIFITDIESKQEMLAQYQKKKTEFEQRIQLTAQGIQDTLEEVRAQIKILKDAQSKDTENEVLRKKLNLYNELYAILKSIQQVYGQLSSSIDAIIKTLTDYLQDPLFEKLKRTDKQVFSFEDLQDIYQRMLDQEKLVATLDGQEKNAYYELENYKRSAIVNAENHAKNRKLLREGALSQSDELIALEDRVFTERKKLDQLQEEGIEYKIELLKLKTFNAKMQRDVLRELFKEHKSTVSVSEADVAYVKDAFEKQREQSPAIARRTTFDNDMEMFDNEIKSRKAELDVLSKRYNISLDSDLDKWTKEPREVVSSYLGIAEVGAENTDLIFVKLKRDLTQVRLEREQEKIHHEEILVKIKETFHKIRARKYTAQELTQEIKIYDALTASVKASLSKYIERRNTYNEMLESRKKAFDNHTHFKDAVQSRRETLFKDSQREMIRIFDVLNTSRKTIIESQRALNAIIADYTDIINSLQSSLKQIDFIVSELNSITIWYRPQYAITWGGLQRLIPDLEEYFKGLLNHFVRFDTSGIISRLTSYVNEPISSLLILAQLLFLLIFLFVLRRFLPRLLHHVQVWIQTHPHMRMLGMLFIAIGRFFLEYFYSILIWLLLWAAFKTGFLADPYVHSLFYLFSIPYILFLANKLLVFLNQFNQDHGYVFISQEYEFRFSIILSVLVYLTIILYFFRLAFLTGTYRRSELPTILVALNFILLQIALIASIGKEQVLGLIPRVGIGEWLYNKIDRYYYFVLFGVISVIIMSNPYVGFGRLIWYTLRKIVVSIAIVFFLIWLHGYVKQLVSYIFFITEEDEVSKERFVYGKTWYGVTMILLFVLFIFVGALILAKTWGWPEHLAKMTHLGDVVNWLNQSFGYVDQKPVSVWLLLQLVFFVIGGITLSFTINHLVLGKIFDILLVDPGIQNAISSITYYVCFALAVIIGFNAVGLTSLLVYLLALVFGLGWIIRDPVSDFVSYFIILVQRPVKVGDLVKFGDSEVPGVVRRITPRAVVLRKRNSTTVIMPNSHVINQRIINWNYARDFIAFDDIFVTISYGSDPNLAQQIFLSVLADSPYMLKNPKPIVRLENFTENGYLFLIRGYMSSNYTLEQWEIASDIRLTITKRLRESGIDIAVPVRILRNNDFHHERQQIEHHK